MQLVEQHIVKTEEWKEWCIKAKNLYNQTLYYWRQSIFGNIEYFTEYQISGLFAEFNEPTFKNLPSGTAQQIIKQVFKNVNIWKKLKKDYSKNPFKYSGKPKMPKYKKELSELYFTSIQIRLKNGFVYFPKMIGIKPIKTKIKNIDCCRVIPKSNHFVVEFVYTVEEKKARSFNGNILGIDLGMNNLATCVTNTGHSFIINGKPLKSINQFYNKRKSKLQSLLPKNKYSSKRIERLTLKRNNKVKNYIHTTSKFIIDKAKKLNITKIVIGNNKNWKQEINLDKKTNQNFVSIPFTNLINKIEYKSKMEGIETIITEESYTSKCSALDLEPICKHTNYLGKRVKRGLFRTKNGFKINADCNGACNIIRKVANNGFNPDLVWSAASAPSKINIFQ